MGRIRYGSLRENKEVMRWYNDVRRGSKVTAEVYLRRLGAFCAASENEPTGLLRLRDKTLANIIDDYVSDRENGGNAGSYIKSTVKAVKSWLTFNGIRLPRKIRISGVEDTPSLKDEVVPTQDEFKQILLAGDSRSRAACALMAFSGLRPGSLGNNDGTDGLVISDIPDLTVIGERITFNEMPAKIAVRKHISKTRKAYITFLGEEGCSYLEAYLRERINQGENVNNDSPVIAYSKGALKSEKFLKSAKIGKLIRETIRKAGFRLRPYVLRDYFDTRLMHAEEDRLIIRDYRTFWMGHKGDIEHTYTVGKNQLPRDTIERMRNSYERAMKLLETEQKRTRDKDVVREVREFAIMMIEGQLGIKVDEEERGRLYSLEIEEFKEELRKMTETNEGNKKDNRKRQIVVSKEKMESLINDEGYEFVNNLGDKVILKLP
jgi:hypothetical protein